MTHIDKWFLNKLQNIANIKLETLKYSLTELNHESFQTLKKNGFSDRQIGTYTNSTELEVFIYANT